MLTRRAFLAAPALAPLAFAADRPPAPYGAIPSHRQLLWHELEFTGFLHFTVNTFTDKEWGYGDEDPSVFSPDQFDADAIVEGLKSAGMRGVILTCKHHDGYCLWPTRTTDHSVRSSKWRGGKGDVVRELSEAAARHGLKFGVYLSPWDRNSALYGGPLYVAMYREQLRELLTNYGPIFEVWHDGANGGDGFYGGAREKRTIDKHTYYDWPRTWELVRSLQPDACIFSDVGPDLRWVGNERGFANETCWAAYDPVAPDGGEAAPGLVRERDSPTGSRNGSHWMPPECDVSIRPGWFWHEKENDRVKSATQLFDLYEKSVGRGGSLLLNVPPDRRGLLADPDRASLAEFGAMLRLTFANNLARHAKMSTKHTAANTADITLQFDREIHINFIRLREAIALGQRVDAFEIDVWHGEWKRIAGGTSIGACRILRTPQPIAANRIRLRTTNAAAPVALSEFSLF
jgi:alpha-L-fucosidase